MATASTGRSPSSSWGCGDRAGVRGARRDRTALRGGADARLRREGERAERARGLHAGADRRHHHRDAALDARAGARLRVHRLDHIGVAVPCSYESLHGVEGDAPLVFHFNGTIFYRGDEGSLQMELVPWSCSVDYALPVAVWRELFPDGVWWHCRRTRWTHCATSSAAAAHRRSTPAWRSCCDARAADRTRCSTRATRSTRTRRARPRTRRRRRSASSARVSTWSCRGSSSAMRTSAARCTSSTEPARVTTSSPATMASPACTCGSGSCETTGGSRCASRTSIRAAGPAARAALHASGPLRPVSLTAGRRASQRQHVSRAGRRRTSSVPPSCCPTTRRSPRRAAATCSTRPRSRRRCCCTCKPSATPSAGVARRTPRVRWR